MSPPRTALLRVDLLALVGLVGVMPLLAVQDSALAYKHLAFLGLSLVGALALAVTAWRGVKLPALGTPTDAALLAWLLVEVLSIGAAINPGMARYELVLSVALGLTYVLAVKGLRAPRDVATVYTAALVAALVIALLGLAGWWRFVQDGAAESERVAYLSTALFAHPYLAAQFVVMVFVGGVVLVLERGLPRPGRLAVLAALLPVGAFVLVTGSRGALLAIGIALLSSGLLRALGASGGQGGLARAARLVLRSSVLGLVVLAALVVAHATGALAALNASTADTPLVGALVRAVSDAVARLALLFDVQHSGFNYSRLTVWYDALRMVAERPLLGVGLGGFDTTFPSHHTGSQSVPHAHNQLVHVLAETGLVGLVAFLFLFRYARRAAVRGAAALADDGVRRPLFHATAAALVAGFVYFLFETPLHWPESGGLLAVLLAVLTRAGCASRDAVTPRLELAAGVLLCVGLLAVGAPAWIGSSRARLSAQRAGELQVQAAEALAEGDVDTARALGEASLDELAAADAFFPHRAEFAQLAALTCQQLGRTDEALAWARLADERVPRVHDHLNMIGSAHLRARRFEEAVAALRAAVDSHQGVQAIETYLQLSRALKGVGRWEQAWFIESDLIERLHWQIQRPVLLLDASDTLLKLDRDLSVAGLMLEQYARLVPGAADEERFRSISQRLAVRRGRDKRVQDRIPLRERERPGEVWGGLKPVRVEGL